MKTFISNLQLLSAHRHIKFYPGSSVPNLWEAFWKICAIRMTVS
jgi:hypothetical protein